MSSDINKIKKLRQSTGAGFKDCSTALQEGNGDIEKDIEILRIKGISKASKKMSRDANEGVVAVSGDEKKLSLITHPILCGLETRSGPMTKIMHSAGAK